MDKISLNHVSMNGNPPLMSEEDFEYLGFSDKSRIWFWGLKVNKRFMWKGRYIIGFGYSKEFSGWTADFELLLNSNYKYVVDKKQKQVFDKLITHGKKEISKPTIYIDEIIGDKRVIKQSIIDKYFI